MKNILLIAYDFNPDVGSEARFAYSWAKTLEKYHNVHVITDIKNRESLTARAETLDITYCSVSSPMVRRILRKLRVYNVLYTLFIRSVGKVLKNGITADIDLIHCLTPAGCYTFNSLYKHGKPIISGPIGGGLKIPDYFGKYKTGRYRIRQLYYRLIKLDPRWKTYYRNCSNILIGTPNLLLQLPRDTHSKTIQFFDTFVDTDKFIPRENKDSELVTIVYSGIMEAFKGCLLLLEVFLRLLESGHQNIRLVMLGDGPQYKKVRQFVKDHNLQDYVTLTGNVGIEAVAGYLRSADIFCLPSVKENGGTSILEAMSCALPVVTADWGGPAVSVNEDCGIKIKPYKYERYLTDIKNALAYLIENRDVRIEMGLNARKRVINEFSHKSLDDSIKKLYDSLFCENQGSMTCNTAN